MSNNKTKTHYIDVIMTTVASQITSLRIVYSIVYSGADQRKHQSSVSLAFVRGIHQDRWIPRTKGQLRGKYLRLLTSSCGYLYNGAVSGERVGKRRRDKTMMFIFNFIIYQSSCLAMTNLPPDDTSFRKTVKFTLYFSTSVLCRVGCSPPINTAIFRSWYLFPRFVPSII